MDALNRVSLIETKTGGTTLLSSYAQSYDLAGNVNEVEGNCSSGGLSDRAIINTYDEINRLTKEVIAVSGGTTTTTAYTFDDAHNRIQKVSGGVTTNYTYNSRNQLTVADDSTTVTTFTYDLNGNRVTRVQGGSTDTYSYDFENRLMTLISDVVSLEWL